MNYSSNSMRINPMTLRNTVLAFFVLLMTSAAAVCFADDSALDKRAQEAEQCFGKVCVERFEEMFQTGNFDFEFQAKGQNVLHYAAFMGDIERVKTLVEKGANVNLITEEGYTVAHYAAQSGSLELVQWLTMHGVNIWRGHNVRTIIHYAARSGNLELVQWLVNQGANVNRKSRRELSVMHYAARSGSLELVQWLAEQGASINVQNKYSVSVLHYAAQSGNLELVQWLVEQGADVGVLTMRDRSLLHSAAKSGNLSLVKWLVQCYTMRFRAEIWRWFSGLLNRALTFMKKTPIIIVFYITPLTAAPARWFNGW